MDLFDKYTAIIGNTLAGLMVAACLGWMITMSIWSSSISNNQILLNQKIHVLENSVSYTNNIPFEINK